MRLVDEGVPGARSLVFPGVFMTPELRSQGKTRMTVQADDDFLSIEEVTLTAAPKRIKRWRRSVIVTSCVESLSSTSAPEP